MLEYDCWSVVLSLQSNLPVHWKFFQDYQIDRTQYNLTYQQTQNTVLLLIIWSMKHKYPVEWRKRNTNKATAPTSGDRSCEDNE